MIQPLHNHGRDVCLGLQLWEGFGFRQAQHIYRESVLRVGYFVLLGEAAEALVCFCQTLGNAMAACPSECTEPTSRKQQGEATA